MRDLALQAAGVLAIVAAIVHGAIAELQVFANGRIEPRRHGHCCNGLASQHGELDRHWGPAHRRARARLGGRPPLGLLMAVLVYGYVAVGNAVVTRGRHFGWCFMGAVVALTLMGL
jgi:hypothetical protein